MAYIKFPTFPLDTDGRMLTDGITDPATGEYLAVTDDSLPSDTTATDSEYADALVRAEAASEAQELPVVPSADGAIVP